MEQKPNIEKSILLNANTGKVWNVLTNPDFAKTLGNELDKGAFLQSDWQDGSQVYFKYAPDKLVATGLITKYKLHSLIFIEYREINYFDSYSLADTHGKTILTIHSGPYPDDYEDQLVAWDKWLLKVKELSEN